MRNWPRGEKIAHKDIKLRTFISQESQRTALASHVYDITYGSVRRGTDNLIVIDDSIVRGTTLRQSILRILDRLGPKKIVVVSSAPQIRYPDCYGIDMAKMGDFIAFEAAIALLRETGKAHLIDEVYKAALEQVQLPKEQVKNVVQRIYEPFTDTEIAYAGKKFNEFSAADFKNCELIFSKQLRQTMVLRNLTIIFNEHHMLNNLLR